MVEEQKEVLSGLKERVLEPDDQAFIEALAADSHQEAYWKGWVTLYTKSNVASVKERILVVTNFRLFTIKLGVMGRSTRQSHAILDLLEISVPRGKEDESHLHLVFSNHTMDIRSTEVVAIAQAIMFAYKSITYGMPTSRLPKVELPHSFFDGFSPPEPDTQDGLLATYAAQCDYHEVPQKLPVLDYFMTCFEMQDRVFDMNDALHNLEKFTTPDIEAIAGALSHSHWYEELVAVNMPLKDANLVALAKIFSSAHQLYKVILVNVGATRRGMAALAARLAEGHHGVKYLNVSKNKIGDAGMRTLVEALEVSGSAMETLCVQQCDFGAKGYNYIATMLMTKPWLNTLRVLDVSDNSAGKAGTTALCEWLAKTTSLEQFYAMRSDLHADKFLAALAENQALSQKKLTTLNVSGNKLSKSSVQLLAEIIASTSSLSHVYVTHSSLKADAINLILSAALSNSNGVEFWIEFSGNDIGTKGAAQMAKILSGDGDGDGDGKGKVRNLHTLVLDSCGLGFDGVLSVCGALQGSNIHTLSIDANMKVGMLGASKGKDVGAALGEFVNKTPALRELSVAGDDSHYLKPAGIVPLIEALHNNKTLKFLDIARNRIGDEGVSALATMLRINTALTSFNAQRNRIGIKSLRDLHAAVKENKTLLDWVIPIHDIEAIYKSCSVKVYKEMESIVFDFDQCMERNAKLHKQREAERQAKQQQQQQAAASANKDDQKQQQPDQGGEKHLEEVLHSALALPTGRARQASRSRRRLSRPAADMFKEITQQRSAWDKNKETSRSSKDGDDDEDEAEESKADATTNDASDSN